VRRGSYALFVRVLVTGANGNVGSAVVGRYLRAGHEVRSFVHGPIEPPGGEVLRGDITDSAALAEATREVQLVVHCAAAVSSDLETCLRVNAEGTRRLVESLAGRERPRFIYLSTISVYDDAAGPSYDEESSLWTSSDGGYGFSKAEAERALRVGVGRELAATILRPPLILSMHPRSRWGPLAVARARTEVGCLLPFPELPYVHVDNLVDAIVLAAGSPRAVGRTYNVVEGVADTREYLEAIHRAAGSSTPPIPADAPRLRFASERIRHELGWAPRDTWREFLSLLREPP
jgi:nucleoside-diphosphate-sugar epimerase